MALFDKLNDIDDNIAYGWTFDGSTFSDEGTMKEWLVIEFEIPMATSSNGVHETTISTQQMPTNVQVNLLRTIFGTKFFKYYFWSKYRTAILFSFKTFNMYPPTSLLCTIWHF